MIGEVTQEYIELLFRTERTGYFANTKGYDLEPDVQVICRMERGEDIGVIVNTAVPETAAFVLSSTAYRHPLTLMSQDVLPIWHSN